MPKTVSEFLTMMDERLWFRMIVCFLPPLVFVKLSGYADEGAFLGKASTAVLLLGVALYIFWPRLRGWGAPVDEDDAGDMEAEDIAPAAAGGSVNVSGRVQVELLTELRGLCQESDRDSDRLIAMEIAVNPQLSYADATRSAINRKRILSK
jgi:hypothetical protein